MSTKEPNEVIIYTDGSCRKSGKGGWACVLIDKARNRRKELSGGREHTTNNRMELLAVIKGLEALKAPCNVTVYSDSQYVVKSMQEGWVKKWSKQSWLLSSGKPAINQDLWQVLLRFVGYHESVTFVWVKGHNGDIENERCDLLATTASGEGIYIRNQNY